MKKLSGLGKFRGMPVSLATLRQDRKCKECREVIPKGTRAYRPILEATVGEVIRCDRICGQCMAAEGEFLPGS